MMVMSDFNEIRCPQERRGCIGYIKNIEDFEEWINGMELVKLPLVSRKFTWRKGSSCSKLDKVFLETKWLQKIVDLKLVGINCSLSDRVSFLVKLEDVN